MCNALGGNVKLLSKIFKRSESSLFQSSRLQTSRGAAGIEYATLLAILCVAIIPALSNFTEKASYKLAGAFQADPENAALRAGPFNPASASNIIGDDDSIQEDIQEDSYLVAQNDGGGTWDGTPPPAAPHINTLMNSTSADSGEDANGRGEGGSGTADSPRTSTSPFVTGAPPPPTGEGVRR